MRLLTPFSALLLSACLLQAQLKTTAVSKKGDWTVNAVADKKGKFVRSEMVRTYNGKQEVSFRLAFDGENFYLDSSADWSSLPDAKSHPAEYRLGSNAGDPNWKGKASVIEDDDGKPWLRITEPNSQETGDALSTAKSLYVTVGKAGSEVQWDFDLKGGNGAYEAMIASFMKNAEPGETEEEGKAKSKAMESLDKKGKKDGAKLIEHEYSRPGDWAVHYYTDKKGKFVQASMIRFYDGDQILRMTMDATHMHIDTAGDWKKLEGAAKDKASGKLSITIASKESPGDNSLKYEGEVINDEGDKWLRMSQSFDEPGGLADGIRNSGTLMLKFGNGKSWTFDLKGSHAAEGAVTECIEKHKK